MSGVLKNVQENLLRGGMRDTSRVNRSGKPFRPMRAIRGLGANVDGSLSGALAPTCALIAARWAAMRWGTLARALRGGLIYDRSKRPVLMAWVLLKPDQWQEAEKELRAALRSHPGCPFACQMLAVGLTARGRTQELREVLEAANRDGPKEASTLALLAYARARCGEVAGAGEMLDQLEPIREPGWRLHEMLLETASTCSRLFLCSRELRWIQDHALASAELRTVLGEVDAGFSCSLKQDPKAFPPIPRPRAFSPEDLNAELERRLTPEERALVVNPVEVTPDIAALAKELAAGVTNQIMRAWLIFGGVAERGHGGGSGGARTAPQALADAKDPQTRFSCQEYAKLFVALARAAGLEAYLVQVDTLADGSVAWHDCAALFLANSSFLVDPTLRLFGFQHRDFRVLDDLQAIAHQAMQGNPSQALPRTRMGLKLDPDDAWTRLRFVEGLTEASLPRRESRLENSHPRRAAIQRLVRASEAYGILTAISIIGPGARPG